MLFGIMYENRRVLNVSESESKVIISQPGESIGLACAISQKLIVTSFGKKY